MLLQSTEAVLTSRSSHFRERKSDGEAGDLPLPATLRETVAACLYLCYLLIQSFLLTGEEERMVCVSFVKGKWYHFISVRGNHSTSLFQERAVSERELKSLYLCLFGQRLTLQRAQRACPLPACFCHSCSISTYSVVSSPTEKAEEIQKYEAISLIFILKNSRNAFLPVYLSLKPVIKCDLLYLLRNSRLNAWEKYRIWKSCSQSFSYSEIPH